MTTFRRSLKDGRHFPHAALTHPAAQDMPVVEVLGLIHGAALGWEHADDVLFQLGAAAIDPLTLCRDLTLGQISRLLVRPGEILELQSVS